MRPLIALLPLAAVACSAGSTGTTPPPPPSVATITVTPGAQTITIGGTATLTAELKTANGAVLSGRTVTWTSSGGSVASVSAAGVVTGKAAGGPVTITATSEGKSGSAQVTVADVAVATVEVTGTMPTLSPGATSQLVATPKSAAGTPLTGRAVTWTSSSLTTATVSTSGLVTAVGPGIVTITATIGGVDGTLQLTVASAIKALALGSDNTCVLRTDGTVLCWGRGDKGAIGDGANTDRLVPTAVSGGLLFKSLTGSGNRNCGITTAGKLYCWGSNYDHGLGIGPLGATPSWVNAPTPSDVAVTTFTQVSSSQYGQLCALTTTGVRYCWGDNDNVELGNGSDVDIVRPLEVAPPLFVTLAMGNYHGCALATGGVAWCWGYNDRGAAGNGTFNTVMVPTKVIGNHTFSHLAVLEGATCGLKTDGTTWCWGEGEYGVFGDGTFGAIRSTPTVVPGAPAFVELAGTSHHVCGRTATGSVYCWGLNADGQLGDGTIIARGVPTKISGTRSYLMIAAGTRQSCGVASDGLYCWGGNPLGLLGDGTTTARPVPTKVIGL